MDWSDYIRWANEIAAKTSTDRSWWKFLNMETVDLLDEVDFDADPVLSLEHGVRERR